MGILGRRKINTLGERYGYRYCGGNTNGNYWKYYWNRVSVIVE